MPNLFEDFTAVLENKEGAGARMVSLLNSEDGSHDREFPGLRDHSQILSRTIDSLLKKGIRHFAGAVWPDGDTAITQTLEWFGNRIESTLMASFCRGVAVGREYRKVVGLSTAQLHALLNHSDEFPAKARVVSLELLLEPQLQEAIAESFSNIFRTFVHDSGFRQMVGKDTQKVWNVWSTTIHANGMGLYAFGIEVGKRQEDRAIFEAIVNKTGEENG